MKKLILLVGILTLTGCGMFERGVAKFTGYSTICVDGVQYIQFTSGASVAYHQDGSIRVCK